MSDATGKTPTPRPLSDMLTEQEARRVSTGASTSSLEGMMAALSAQVTRDAQEKRTAGDTGEPKKG